MLRQSATENKARKVPDVITDSDGRTYRKADFEDEKNPGYTVPGRLYLSPEIAACAAWGLISPSGHRFDALLPRQSAPDPTHVARADVPAPLVEAAAKAWAKLEEIRGRIAAALERRTQAEIAHRRAAARADKRAYNAAISAEMQAEEERIALAMEEAVPRRDAAAAEEVICRWMRDEMLYRTGGAERPQPSAGIF